MSALGQKQTFSMLAQEATFGVGRFLIGKHNMVHRDAGVRPLTCDPSPHRGARRCRYLPLSSRFSLRLRHFASPTKTRTTTIATASRISGPKPPPEPAPLVPWANAGEMSIPTSNKQCDEMLPRTRQLGEISLCLLRLCP